jgi:hypothetical protein
MDNLFNKIRDCFAESGITIRHDEKLERFIEDMKQDYNRVLVITETQAVATLCRWLKHDADMNDLAREYSRILFDGVVRVVRDGAEDRGVGGDNSDNHQNGEIVEIVYKE